MVQMTICYLRCVTITLTEENATKLNEQQLLDELEVNGYPLANSPIQEIVENERLNIEVTNTNID